MVLTVTALVIIGPIIGLCIIGTIFWKKRKNRKARELRDRNETTVQQVAISEVNKTAQFEDEVDKEMARQGNLQARVKAEATVRAREGTA